MAPTRLAVLAVVAAVIPRQSASFLVTPTPMESPLTLTRATTLNARVHVHSHMQMAEKDLLIVGAGTLGMRLIKQYKEEHPSARIVACTNTTKRHADLEALGAEPTLGLPESTFPNVAFLATPNAKDYNDLCSRTLDIWSAPAQRGRYIMASSIGVFAKGVPEGTRLTEADAINASSSNFSRTLVAAEEQVLGQGGTVMRIAGMYNLRAGRNSFFLKGGEVKRRGDAYISLVGYDDVVSAALKIYDAPAEKVCGQVFTVADGHVQTVESVFEHGHACLRQLGEDPTPARFTGVEASRGVLHDNKKARTVLGWSPSIASFQEYCRLVGQGLREP